MVKLMALFDQKHVKVPVPWCALVWQEKLLPPTVVQVLDAPIQCPASGPGEAVEMPGTLPPWGRPRWTCWLQASARPNPQHCYQLGSKAAKNCTLCL